jgi:hypothetical protein
MYNSKNFLKSSVLKTCKKDYAYFILLCSNYTWLPNELREEPVYICVCISGENQGRTQINVSKPGSYFNIPVPYGEFRDHYESFQDLHHGHLWHDVILTYCVRSCVGHVWSVSCQFVSVKGHNLATLVNVTSSSHAALRIATCSPNHLPAKSLLALTKFDVPYMLTRPQTASM